MPVYTCSGKAGSISPSQKKQIAQDITDIHCTTTVVPPTFVHVLFFDQDNTSGWPETDQISLFGSIRDERSEETIASLKEQIRTSVSQTLGLGLDKVPMTIRDQPARWTMEGGHLLPVAGDEAEWQAAHDARIAASGAP